MHQGSLSVVMPNYNHGKYIARSIEAVISQSRPPDEYIILDDGSTDNSVEIIESYVQQYPSIQLVRNEQNTGAPEAIRRVVNLASGDYIYADSADDYVLPGFFEKAMQMAAQYPQAGIIFGKMIAGDTDGNELGVYGVPRWQHPLFVPPERFLREYLAVEAPEHSLCATTVYKREALENIGGFREELGSWCDTFAARAIALKDGACYLPQPVAMWTYLPESLSSSTANNPHQMLDIIARAAWLMRSSEFREYFPEEYVAQWESEYRQVIINAHIKRLRSCFQMSQTIYQRGMDGEKWHYRLLEQVYRAWTRLEQRIWVKSLKLALQRYQGDISCYHTDGSSVPSSSSTPTTT
ncbi:glycosyltransferase [candidate division KSB3 bacterium]|uniref:Glycosyltransferase n=1 Tax=candidate division KSB3 bacterium TaxID=2044937 RepID=A0A9D5JXP1_9BACT|nr:glycosyltransferase [candidate division KSB3 bacterium]MBD3326073.1 glycosyltransferase [candidate division KSB3 bacterium]